MNPRSEPLLWLQLTSLGVLPLEMLLVLLVLSSADPGPLPGLERLLVWALGAVAPTVVLWRKPADPGSLLLVKQPLPLRSELARRLAALQTHILPRLLLVLGTVLLLPLVWWLDRIAALASALSPLEEPGRLLSLLITVPLLALVVWQWHQLVQAIWLLSRSPEQLAATMPLSPGTMANGRSSPGLPLLSLGSLQLAVATAPPQPPQPSQRPQQPQPASTATVESAEETASSAEAADSIQEAASTEERNPTKGNSPGETPTSTGAIAIKPEQTSENP